MTRFKAYRSADAIKFRHCNERGASIERRIKVLRTVCTMNRICFSKTMETGVLSADETTLPRQDMILFIFFETQISKHRLK